MRPAITSNAYNLTVQIAALRRALGDAADGGGWIETLARRYRYIGPTVTIHGPDAQPAERAVPPLVLPEKPSVAVLPFSNLSGDPEHDYFDDGGSKLAHTAVPNDNRGSIRQSTTT